MGQLDLGRLLAADAWDSDRVYVKTLKFQWTGIAVGVSVNNLNKKSLV